MVIACILVFLIAGAAVAGLRVFKVHTVLALAAVVTGLACYHPTGCLPGRLTDPALGVWIGSGVLLFYLIGTVSLLHGR